MKLVDFLARMCHYAQEHIDDPEAWGDPEYVGTIGDRETMLQCTSFAVACFLAQNTLDGEQGVEWEVVLDEIVKWPMKPIRAWKTILNRKARELGGWKKEAKGA